MVSYYHIFWKIRSEFVNPVKNQTKYVVNFLGQDNKDDAHVLIVSFTVNFTGRKETNTNVSDSQRQTAKRATK